MKCENCGDLSPETNDYVCCEENKIEQKAKLIMLQFISPAASHNSEWFEDLEVVIKIIKEADAEGYQRGSAEGYRRGIQKAIDKCNETANSYADELRKWSAENDEILEAKRFTAEGLAIELQRGTGGGE